MSPEHECVASVSIAGFGSVREPSGDGLLWVWSPMYPQTGLQMDTIPSPDASPIIPATGILTASTFHLDSAGRMKEKGVAFHEVIRSISCREEIDHDSYARKLYQILCT
jgi:hypothetical protein